MMSNPFQFSRTNLTTSHCIWTSLSFRGALVDKSDCYRLALYLAVLMSMMAKTYWHTYCILKCSKDIIKYKEPNKIMSQRLYTTKKISHTCTS